MSGITKDIPITLDSSAVGNDKKIVVFGSKLSVVTSQDINIAWQVIPSGSVASFHYPHETNIGVYYYSGSNKILVLSQVAAAPGTTWDYLAKSTDEEGTIELDQSVRVRSDGIYAILNQKPDSWSGRLVNVGLYKDSKLFMVEPSVGVDSFAEMTVSNKLYFAVVVHSDFITNGKMFVPSFVNVFSKENSASAILPEVLEAQVSQLKEVDLNQYPNGVTVTITQDKSSLRFIFDMKPTK